MNLDALREYAKDKSNFLQLSDYATFGQNYLEFIQAGLQAVIVARAEPNYQFFQYKADGDYTFTRPINHRLMLSADEFDSVYRTFVSALPCIQDIRDDMDARAAINKVIYTCQQSIGATLDSLPAGESNAARKINGDLFERLIRILISEIGINVRDGVVNVPVMVDGQELCCMKYQHDLIIESDGELRAIGSVKTSSKDRLDKVFIDKFLYNRLTNVDTPHFAVFLNDVQRAGREPNYRVATTFLTGHFKGYTIKLNPLDGVYYCDMRPIMREDPLLSSSIRSLDYLLVEDIWNF